MAKAKKKAKPKSIQPEVFVWQKQLGKAHRFHGLSFGLLVFMLGIFWLGSEIGWIPEIPFWPLVLVIVGIWLIFKAMLRRVWSC